MADSSGLSNWLIRHSRSLGLEVNHFTWTREWLPRYTDVSISLRWNGRAFVGRSLAATEDESILKAGAEALERLAQAQNNIPTSNGMAAHFSRKAAREGGLRELIERDRLLCHTLTGTPFLPCPEESLGEELREVRERLAGRGVKLEVREMRRLNGNFSVACAAFGETFSRPFGMVAGFGCDRDLNTATRGAVLECLRHVLPVMEEEEIPLSPEAFAALPFPGPSDHYRLALNLDVAREHAKLFCPAPSGVPEENFTIRTEERTLPLDLPGDLPGFLVLQISSPDLQPFFFGHPAEADLRRDILRRFSDRPPKPVAHFLS